MFEQFEVRDDGTLDTVIACRLCDREYRFTYMPEILPAPWDVPADEMSYEEFVSNCIDDIREEHDCNDHE